MSEAPEKVYMDVGATGVYEKPMPGDTEYIRADIHQDKIEKLLAACKTAIRIKKLWRPKGIYGMDSKDEMKAVEAMYQKLKKAINFAKT